MWLLRRTGWLLYQALMAAGLLLAAPFLLATRGTHYLKTLRGRLGFHAGFHAGSHAGPQRGPRLDGAVWIHAVSVGEVGVAATLARQLPDSLPLVVTTVTPTGQEQARKLFADLGTSRPVAVTYLPFDLGFAVSSFYRRFTPALLILVEGDYWPLVLHHARRRRIPVAVVNGRMGTRSSARLGRVPWLGGPLFFAGITRFGMQTDEDCRRLVAAGAGGESVQVTGNLKFDSPEPPAREAFEAGIRRLAAGRPVLVAGSTMPGEEEKILEAFRRIGAGRRALLIIAPRHPERWDAVARRVGEAGLECLRRSVALAADGSVALAADGGALAAGDPARDVLLLDSLGELAALYRLAAIAFIGGTLVPTGGHNPLEPAHFAVPIAVGPSMENFRDIAERFDRDDAWRRVADPQALADLFAEWLEQPQQAQATGRRAAALLATGRGAVERTVEMLKPLLPGAPAKGPRERNS